MLKQLVLLAGLMISMATLSADTIALEGTAAIVGTEVITYQEVAESQQWMQAQTRRAISYDAALGRLIDEKLQEVLADKLGIKVDDAMLNDTINNMASARRLTTTAYQTKIEEGGITWAEYQERIRRDLRLMLLQKRIVSSEEDLPSAYAAWLKQHRDDWTQMQLDYWVFPVDAPQGDRAWKQARDHAYQWKLSLMKGDGEALPPEGAQLHHESMKPVSQLPDLWVKAWRNHRRDSVIGPIEVGAGYHLLVVKELNEPAGRNNVGFERFMSEEVEKFLPKWLDRAKKEVYIHRSAPPQHS